MGGASILYVCPAQRMAAHTYIPPNAIHKEACLDKETRKDEQQNGREPVTKSSHLFFKKCSRHTQVCRYGVACAAARDRTTSLRRKLKS